MKFNENIRRLRKNRKLSRIELANLLGISEHAVASYENGRRLPDAKAIYLIEKFFRISTKRLFGDTFDEPKQG